jgi:hypothetical protein
LNPAVQVGQTIQSQYPTKRQKNVVDRKSHKIKLVHSVIGQIHNFEIMRFFHSESFLLLAATSLSLYSVDAYSECDNKYWDFLFGVDCQGNGNFCPSACKQAVDDVHDICSKDGATLDEVPYDATNFLMSTFIWFAESPCLSEIRDNLLEHIPDTCQSHAVIHTTTSYLLCGEGSVCSQLCRDIQDDFYGTCTKDDVMIWTEDYTDETTHIPVTNILTYEDMYLSEACNEYSNNKEFKGTTGTSVEPIGSENNECDIKVLDFLFGYDCTTDGDFCPSSMCKQAVDNVNDECSKDGATLDGVPYDATNVLLSSIFMFAESPCLSEIRDNLLHVPDTCQSHASIHTTSTMLLCGEGGVCSEFCRDVQDGFYATCTEDDVMIWTDNESGTTSYYPITDILLFDDMYLSESCKNYSNGKEFGTPIEPVVTSACADQGGKPILWGNKGKPKSCEFAKKGKKRKCKKYNIAEVCPETCGECDGGSTTEPSDCEDSKGKVVPFRKNKPKKTCKWAKKNTKRCDKNGVAELCPKSCGMC